MTQQILNLSLLFLLAAGCKLSAANQTEQPSMTTPSPSATAAANHPQEAGNSAAPEATPKPATTAAAQANAVCPDPNKPCQHREKQFDEWELSFKMPARLKANTPYESAPFYAVILKTYPMDEDCDGGEFIEAAERDRKREQSNQLERKVFGSYQCPNMAAVQYDFEGRLDASGESVAVGNFIAIYAGATRAEAEETLRFMKSEYPQAQLKQMRASYEKIEQ